MIAVILANTLVFQQALGGFHLRGVEVAIAGQIQLIMAFAGFAAGVTLGARGGTARTAVSVALVIGASSLLLLGYLVPLGEALAGVARPSALPGWTPLNWALPAHGALIPHRPLPPSLQGISAWSKQANSHSVESYALLGVVLTLTGVAVGQWTGATRDLLTRHVLPWVIGLGLFGAMRLSEPISRAITLWMLNRANNRWQPDVLISPTFVAYLPLAVPVAVLATLLWVRYAEAAASAKADVQP